MTQTQVRIWRQSDEDGACLTNCLWNKTVAFLNGIFSMLNIDPDTVALGQAGVKQELAEAFFTIVRPAATAAQR